MLRPTAKSDHPAGPCVQDQGGIGEATGDRDVRQIGHPQLIRAMNFVPSGDERKDRTVVDRYRWCARNVFVVAGSGRFSFISRRTFFGVHHEPAVTKLGVDAAIPIPFKLVGDVAHLGQELPHLRACRGVRRKKLDRETPISSHPRWIERLAGPPVADVGALFGKGPERRPPFRNSISSAWRPTKAFKGGDARLVVRKQFPRRPRSSVKRTGLCFFRSRCGSSFVTRRGVDPACAGSPRHDTRQRPVRLNSVLWLR